MENPGNPLSTGGTKNIPDACTERKSLDKLWVPPKFDFPNHRGSRSMKSKRLGSFWKLTKFKPTLTDPRSLAQGSMNSNPCLYIRREEGSLLLVWPM